MSTQLLQLAPKRENLKRGGEETPRCRMKMKCAKRKSINVVMCDGRTEFIKEELLSYLPMGRRWRIDHARSK
jgi:hypothetical protein